MTISSSYKDLFRTPMTRDKLILFQSLLDAREDMTGNLAFALLKIIHRELTVHQNRDRSVYKDYAEAIEALNFHLPNVLQQVVDAWNPNRMSPPAEWFAHEQSRDA